MKNTMKKFIFLGMLPLLGVAGCATQPVSMQVDQVAQTQKFAPQPFVKTLSQPPSSPYVVIANIDASGAQGITEQQVLASVIQKAQNLGANAVIIQNQTSPTVPSMDFNPSGGQYVNMPTPTLPKFHAIAIFIENSASN